MLVVVGFVAALALSPNVVHADTDTDTTVAVMYFDHNTKVEELAFLRKGLAQMLAVDLAKTSGITVVERLRLEEILAELKLNKSNKIDRKSAIKAGKLLGARYLVMGSYNDFRGDVLNVIVKVVDVQTGASEGLHDHRKVEEFWAQEQYLAGEIATILRGKVVALDKQRTRAQKIARAKRARRAKKKRAAVAKARAAERTSAKKTALPAMGGATSKTASSSAKTAVDARTVARYGKALDALDRGDKDAARAELKAVVAKSPSFSIATADLASLAQ